MNDRYHIGERNDIMINDNDIIIPISDDHNQVYKFDGTEGLWKLLKLKNPGGDYTDEDLEVYMNILKVTNHQLRANKTPKWKIIKGYKGI